MKRANVAIVAIGVQCLGPPLSTSAVTSKSGGTTLSSSEGLSLAVEVGVANLDAYGSGWAMTDVLFAVTGVNADPETVLLLVDGSEVDLFVLDSVAGGFTYWANWGADCGPSECAPELSRTVRLENGSGSAVDVVWDVEVFFEGSGGCDQPTPSLELDVLEDGESGKFRH